MKKSIKNVLAGILMVSVLAFGSILVTPLTASAVCDINGGVQAGADCGKGAEQPSDLFGAGGIFQTITNTALFIIGALSVIMLIYGGIRYTLSAGDAKHVEAAKNTIMYAIIGIVVALLAYAIVNFVLGTLIS